MASSSGSNSRTDSFPIASAASAQDSNDNTALGPGHIAGIVIAAVAVVAGIIGMTIFLIQRHRKHRFQEASAIRKAGAYSEMTEFKSELTLECSDLTSASVPIVAI